MEHTPVGLWISSEKKYTSGSVGMQEMARDVAV